MINVVGMKYLAVRNVKDPDSDKIIKSDYGGKTATIIIDIHRY